MAEENINADPSEEYNDDGTKNPDYVPPKDETESVGDTDTENKGEEEQAAEDDEGEGEDGDFDDTIDPEKPPEIPTRVAQHIIARKDAKIKKLESKLDNNDNEGDDGASDEEEESDLTPEASKAIDGKLNKMLAPLLGKLASDADNLEMDNLIKAEPEAKKYVNHIKAYMSHPEYKGVSPVVIFHHLAYAAAQALGAKKRKAADLEAGQKKGAGRQTATTGKVSDLPSAEDIENMSDEDFAKMEEKALRGDFLKK